MKVAVFSSRKYDRDALSAALAAEGEGGRWHEFVFLEAGLEAKTAVLAEGCGGVCLFVNDRGDRASLEVLARGGVKVILLRSAGFNHVDLRAAEALGMVVLRVPAYSPEGVAEHAVGLMLTLSRKYHRAYNRVREHNFNLEGLMGFTLHGKTVGVVGTGKIGECVCRILAGFGCRLLVRDVVENSAVVELGARYVSLEEMLPQCDLVTLHCPLMPETRHLINAERLALMKRGVCIVNTSRGRLLDTRAAIEALKSGQIGSLGLDVYEEEERLFFRDLSDALPTDDLFARLLTFPNVVITAHQAFFTQEAMGEIARTTVGNLVGFAEGRVEERNRVRGERVK